ncbi:MAG: NAD(P)/FAD-dependent oxidoreductase [Bacilli bacterium]
MKKVAVIGGGVSGVTFALETQEKCIVTIFERENGLLLKLLKTGNGKANIYNRDIKLDAYNDQNFMVNHALEIEKTLDAFFFKLGVLTYTDSEKRVYPYSRSASGLREYLLSLLKVKIKVNTNIDSVSKVNGQYLINGEYFDYVVLATGSGAGLSKYGLTNNNDPLLKSLNLERSALVPVIKTIAVKENLKVLNNRRADVMMTLWLDDKVLVKERGEVLFKRDGLSGIVSFIVSSYFEWAIQEQKDANYKVTLDLMPDHTSSDVLKIIKSKDDYPKVFAPFLVDYLMNLKDDNILKNVKALNFTPVPFNYPENSQAMSGGIKVREVANDFAHQKEVGLFILGEVLNIDGICGGYNLGFAIYSGIIASRSLLYKLSI